MPNELLHAHLTRVGFDLSLGRTHIAALVMLNESLRVGQFRRARASGRNPFSMFASGTHGLIQRGLVQHHYTIDKKTGRAAEGVAPHYTITKAGELVIALLQEAGMYDQYAGQLNVVAA